MKPFRVRGITASELSAPRKIVSARKLKDANAWSTTVRFVNSGSKYERSPDFKAKPKQIHVNYKKSPTPVREIIIGLGPTEKMTVAQFKGAVHAAVAKLKEFKVDKATIYPPLAFNQAICPAERAPGGECFHLKGYGHGRTTVGAANIAMLQLMSQWLTSFNYKTTKYKSKSDEHFLTSVDLVVPNIQTKENASKAIAKGAGIGAAANAAKDLGNTRPDEGTPLYYAKWAEKLVKQHKCLRIRNWIRGKDLQKKGLNLHWNVGKGSEFPPQLVIMEYIGAPNKRHSTAIVGKGVTFDTGGLHVKPFGAMENMHLDMMGAGCVLGTMQAIAELKPKCNVIGVVGLAENAIGSKAYRPSSIIKSLKGTTVEVLNTDAEGRLVLADCLTFVQDHARVAKKPTEIIDLATLTGAVLIALGSDRAAIFSNNDEMRRELYQSGVETQEPVWPLPIGPEHDEKMKGNMSDLKNIGGGREAGSSTAAAFLKHFINDGMPWTHIDIAGTGMNDKTLGAQPGGVPGYGVALLTNYLVNSKPKKMSKSSSKKKTEE